MSEFQWGVQIPEPDINESGEFFAALADHTCSALVAALKTCSYGRLYWNACVVLAVKPMVSPCDHG